MNDTDETSTPETRRAGSPRMKKPQPSRPGPDAPPNDSVFLETLESHFAVADPVLLTLARLLYAARRKMQGPLGTVGDDVPVWLDVEKIIAMKHGLERADALLVELARLQIITLSRRTFGGLAIDGYPDRVSIGFVWRPIADWTLPVRDPRREPAPGDRFRSPNLATCHRVVTTTTCDAGRVATVSYQRTYDDGALRPGVVTVDRDAWDRYVARMIVDDTERV